MHPKISIIIPVKNGEATIAQCLDVIKKQTLFSQTEVIIIDSGSTDNTLDILKNYSFIKLFQIKPEEFNHGTTRNLGVSLAKGEFVVMTVQDARASNEKWLETMIKHFSNSEVAAVTGQQVIPHEKDKNPHQWFRPQSKPSVWSAQFNNKNDFLNLTSKEQFAVCKVDDVNTMYRKSILEKIPFRKTAFGEDIWWAKDVLENGYKIVYDNNAQVYHYHHQNYEYAYKINYVLNIYLYRIFALEPDFKLKITDILYIIYRNFKYRAKLKWIFFNIKMLFATKKAQNDFFKHKKKNNFEMEVPQGKQNN